MKYSEDVFKVRKDKKKDYYFLLNEKIEKNDNNDLNSTYQSSSFILGVNSNKNDEIFIMTQNNDLVEKIDINIKDFTKNKTPFIDFKERKTIEKTPQFSINMKNDIEESGEIKSLKQKPIEKIAETKQNIQKELPKTKTDIYNANIDRLTLERNLKREKSTLEKQSKMKKSILSHWEETKSPTQKYEDIKIISIIKEEGESLLVF